MNQVSAIVRLTIFVVAFVVFSSSAGFAESNQPVGTVSHADEPARAVNEDIPDLPFADNPDPDACGIPQRVGSDDVAWLSGFYEGELIEPIVHFYDSHLRGEITGQAPSGTQVKLILFQDNPVLNYYMVEVTDEEGEIQSGWVPAPFLEFEAPE